MKTVDELLNEYLEIKVNIKLLIDEQDFVKNQLKIIMERDGVESLENKMCYAFIQNRTTQQLNKEKIKEFLGDNFKEVVNEKVTSFLMVKEK